MVKGNAYVVAEFVLINRNGRYTNQETVTGYSKISDMNTESQREILFENALNHARSKFLKMNNKDSTDDTDFSIVDSGFKVEYIRKKDNYRELHPSKRKLSTKKQYEIGKMLLEKVDVRRDDKDKQQTREEYNKMFKKETPKKKITEKRLDKMSKKELKAYILKQQENY